mgnify:CR=1 FL=1
MTGKSLDCRNIQNTEVPVELRFLQIGSRAQIRPKRTKNSKTRISKMQNPNPKFTQWLYQHIGRDWWWVGRYYWSMDQWKNRFRNPSVSLWLMETSSKLEMHPAGYYELEKHEASDIEISSFGLLPHSIGKGLGGHMLTDGLERAFDMGAKRVWVETSSLDHRYALENYKARGMEVYMIRQHMLSVPLDWPPLPTRINQPPLAC